jgi:hypothetical protein
MQSVLVFIIDGTFPVIAIAGFKGFFICLLLLYLSGKPAL